MDLTPRVLTEVEFREQWRGYSPNDVDDFLERVAAAVGVLQEQLKEMTERAAAAERRLLDRSDDDEIRRTLVLAQRTAAQAVEEARAEAERILDDADQRAREQVADAEARLANVEAEIAERARVELGALADRRAALQADVEALVAFQEEHKVRLRAELQRQLAELDAPATSMSVPEPPEMTDVDLSLPASLDIEIEAPPTPQRPDAGGSRPPTDEEVARAREDLVAALRRAGVEEFQAAPDPTESWTPAWDDQPEAEGAPAEAVVEPVPETDAEVQAPPQLYDAADESGEIEVQWRAEPASTEASGPESGPVPSFTDDDDPFLAELRRAVTDPEPLGPRDDHVEVPEDGGDPDDATPSGRFRLRRGR